MATRDPNACLSRLLTETGWTYGQFAMSVNRLGTETGRPLRYGETAVHMWLGGTMPRSWVRPLILEALSRRLGRPVTHAEAGFPAPDVQTASVTADTVEGLVEIGRDDMDPSRRGVLGASLFSMALAIPGWPDVVGRAEAVQAGRTKRIGSGEVDMVVAMTERISELDDQFGGRHARPLAASFLVNTVAPCLRADGPEAVRKAMFSGASNLCHLAGYMAVDEGLQGLAQRYYVKGLELAGAAEDHLSYCSRLRAMSVQAVDLGNSAKAVRLADAAAAASPQAGPRIRAYLAGQQAHAAAQVGERAKAVRYIGETEAAMDRADLGERMVIGGYSLAALRYHISQVRYHTGDRQGAVEVMQQSEQVRDGAHRRNRVRYQAMLAERQLETGHLEAACATWHSVLDEYPLVHSGRCDQRISTMYALIRPHLANRTARELHNRARDVAPAPAKRLAPA